MALLCTVRYPWGGNKKYTQTNSRSKGGLGVVQVVERDELDEDSVFGGKLIHPLRDQRLELLLQSKAPKAVLVTVTTGS